MDQPRSQGFSLLRGGCRAPTKKGKALGTRLGMDPSPGYALGQYSPVRLEQARLVSSFYMALILAANFEFASFRKQKKLHGYDRFHGNGQSGKIPTKKKKPITALGFTSRSPCHITITNILCIETDILQTQRPK